MRKPSSDCSSGTGCVMKKWTKLLPLCFVFAGLGCQPTALVTHAVRSGPLEFKKPTAPTPDPKRVLDDAIQARGGEALLEKLRQNFCLGEGINIILNQPQRFQFKTHSALPDRLRDESRYENGMHTLQILDGAKGWVSLGRDLKNMDVKNMDAVTLQSLRDQLYVNNLMTLVPLKEPRYTLVALPEQRKDGYSCEAFTVQSKDQRDVTFFFDKATH